jgi:hypothetical protein
VPVSVQVNVCWKSCGSHVRHETFYVLRVSVVGHRNDFSVQG